MSKKMYLIVEDWKDTTSTRGESLNKLQKCEYVSDPIYSRVPQKFRDAHKLWGRRTYTVSATEADIILFRLDSRYSNFKVFPYPGIQQMSKTFIISAGGQGAFPSHISLNKLQKCKYVSDPVFTIIGLKFRNKHKLWGHHMYAVSATEADILLFQLDSRYSNFKVFPHPGDPTDE
jgi:hypothetical protein